MRIDSHNHFWNYDPVQYPWINGEMEILKRSYLPIDLSRELHKNNISGCVAVQACESRIDNDFLLKLADKSDFIKGVVGWVDMLSDSIGEDIERYSQSKKMKGFRYVLQDKNDRELMLHPKFKNNISTLAKYDFVYDILIYEDQLQFVPQLIDLFPNQKFVIDHLAKPRIKENELNTWKKKIQLLARYENVYCKLSGMVTESNWKCIRYEDFVPYLDTAFQTFGNKRLLFGSDWPVCLLASSYENVVGIVSEFISELSANEQNDIMGNNAIQIYNL